MEDLSISRYRFEIVYWEKAYRPLPLNLLKSGVDYADIVKCHVRSAWWDQAAPQKEGLDHHPMTTCRILF